jgi:hypothetical protein
MAASDSRPGARGDEAELFRAYNDELLRIVSRGVRDVSPQTIEDACAFAWAQFMVHQPDRDRNCGSPRDTGACTAWRGDANPAPRSG